MLEGKGPLYLPPYTGTLPGVVSLTCPCGVLCVVFTGAVVRDGGVEAVKSQAEATGRVFVDARVEPFKLCGCGQLLDFTAGESVEAVM